MADYIGNEARHSRVQLRFDKTPYAPPAVEPVSVADVKAHRRLDDDDDTQDALIALLIQQAREYAEAKTGRRLIRQSWRAVMDGFPGVVIPPTPFAAVAAWLPSPQPSPEISIAWGPTTAVESIQYLDVNGARQTLPAQQYVLDVSGELDRIAPSYGNQWPATLPQIGSVELRLTMGYGAAPEDVPAAIRLWMLMRIGTVYENREEVSQPSRGAIQAIPYLDRMLDPYIIPVI